MKRWDVINRLIKKNGYNRYLEIGFGDGDTFNLIKIDDKTGVDPDPDPSCDYEISSEEFFSYAKENDLGKFDIIFIDGNHNSSFVRNDVMSALDMLSENGAIVMHDCNPTTEKMQRTDILVTDFWTGDVWKVFAEYRILRDDLYMYVVDTDFGCGVIQFGKQEKCDAEISDLTYEYFSKNKNKLMNIISVDKFKEVC